MKTAVIIPCYRVRSHIADVLAGLGDEVDRIYVVDDACPEGSGEFVERHVSDPRIAVLRHEDNAGVGGATVTGYRRAIADGADILVKIDGDGQMDPALIPRLIRPIEAGAADYVKGNRFYDLDRVWRMPITRLIGNATLSFVNKASSGYWSIFDPTNGFTALHARVAELLPLDKIHRGYFFESDMLFRLNLLRAVVRDVPMPPRYADELSSLRVRSIVPTFLAGHLTNAAKRIIYNYFVHDFSIATVELVLGTVFTTFGGVFGVTQWLASTATGVPATAGTVMLAALPAVMGMQMLLAFLGHDVQDSPRTPVHRDLD